MPAHRTLGAQQGRDLLPGPAAPSPEPTVAQLAERLVGDSLDEGVAGSSPAGGTTLQALVDAASDGDTIEVPVDADGVFHASEPIVVRDRKRLTFAVTHGLRADGITFVTPAPRGS